MAAEMPNPTNLTSATRLPPKHARTVSKSRSPSRSPVRKAQFAARELDPLLKNLSPDSTLQALQKTNNIVGNQAEKNAIAQSISDASEQEREKGVRAAVAAKKLGEWTQEITAWPWPNRSDRAWGAGFCPPVQPEEGTTAYFGSLPRGLVKQYEERLDEIWDAIETLGMDELKDFVFSSHHPQTTANASRSFPSSYGRMRDFTALITATVVQALPVLAKLHILLDTWSVRLSVLRQIPNLLLHLEQVKVGLATITDIVQDDSRSRKLTKAELERGKAMFGNRVSDLGQRMDKLLDLLEGQEDSLPQAWIDSLEDIENKYAEWVSQAEHVVLRNETATQAGSHDHVRTGPSHTPATPEPVEKQAIELEATSVPKLIIASPPNASPSPSPVVTVVKRKPLVEINPKSDKSHQRGISEVSAADSALSGYSIETAEIVDATETKVLPSPRISVIDMHFSAPKAASSWMASGSQQNQPPPRPSMVQRASKPSTASIETVPKSQAKEVTLRRSASWDMLALSSKSSSSTLQPNRTNRMGEKSMPASPQREIDNPAFPLQHPTSNLTPLVSPSPSLQVDPLSVKGKEMIQPVRDIPPLVPRRSSKRLSLPWVHPTARPSTPPQQTMPEHVNEMREESQPVFKVPQTPPSKVKKEETFDDKLKSILANMPTKIKLTEGSDSSGSSDVSSQCSSRASSPMQVLKLSPAKGHKDAHKNNSSGIRVYHLSKSGKVKDAAPVKLYVRAVGEHGERLMVRVGGGWADLAEYLREYSLHHGGRGFPGGKLEVAGYPRTTSTLPKTSTSALQAARGTSPDSKKSSQAPAVDFDFSIPNANNTPDVPGDQVHIANVDPDRPQDAVWRPPPVPVIPKNYQGRSSSPTPNPRNDRGQTPTNNLRPSSRIFVHTTPTITTTVVHSNDYTPLGAAGPVQHNRRVIPNSHSRTPTDEAWVAGMVNQARAVSGSQPHTHTHSHTSHQRPMSALSFTPIDTTATNTITYQSPTITTSTIFTPHGRATSYTSSSTARRVVSLSAMNAASTPTPTTSYNTATSSARPPANPSPVGSQLSDVTGTSSGSSESYATARTNGSSTNKLTKARPNENGNGSGTSDGLNRLKSRMSLGDVGGIRRVFLRKKSEK